MRITPIDILNRLEDNQFEAYFVGGCVRDELLGEPVMDYDITTNATPEDIETVFSEQILNFVGKTFGVMRVNDIEVASYRTEVYDTIGKPVVSIANSYYEDASRRDFTINAMAKSVRGDIIDYFNGKSDIKNKLIRAVGNPVDRFKEDPSRIVRGMYLAARLGFSIEEKTFHAMKEYGMMLESVPIELIGKYLEKVIHHNVLSTFVRYLEKSGNLKYVFPEIVHTIGLPQNPKYHHLHVFDHILAVLEAVEMRYPKDVVMALAALYHDCEKGREGIRGLNKSGQPNDLGHEEAGAPISERAVTRFNFGKHIANQVGFLVRFHGLRLDENPKPSTVRRMIQKLVPFFLDKGSLVQGVERLFAFIGCDTEGFNPVFKTEVIRVNNSVYNVLLEVLSDTIFYRSELPISGKDLVDIGITGRQVGEILDNLVSQNLQDRKIIMDIIRKRLESKSC